MLVLEYKNINSHQRYDLAWASTKHFNALFDEYFCSLLCDLRTHTLLLRVIILLPVARHFQAAGIATNIVRLFLQRIADLLFARSISCQLASQNISFCNYNFLILNCMFYSFFMQNNRNVLKSKYIFYFLSGKHGSLQIYFGFSIAAGT